MSSLIVSRFKKNTKHRKHGKHTKHSDKEQDEVKDVLAVAIEDCTRKLIKKLR